MLHNDGNVVLEILTKETAERFVIPRYSRTLEKVTRRPPLTKVSLSLEISSANSKDQQSRMLTMASLNSFRSAIDFMLQESGDPLPLWYETMKHFFSGLRRNKASERQTRER